MPIKCTHTDTEQKEEKEQKKNEPLKKNKIQFVPNVEKRY